MATYRLFSILTKIIKSKITDMTRTEIADPMTIEFTKKEPAVLRFTEVQTLVPIATITAPVTEVQTLVPIATPTLVITKVPVATITAPVTEVHTLVPIATRTATKAPIKELASLVIGVHTSLARTATRAPIKEIASLVIGVHTSLTTAATERNNETDTKSICIPLKRTNINDNRLNGIQSLFRIKIDPFSEINYHLHVRLKHFFRYCMTIIQFPRLVTD